MILPDCLLTRSRFDSGFEFTEIFGIYGDSPLCHCLFMGGWGGGQHLQVGPIPSLFEKFR
jgi:hypothetical protein